MASMYKNKGIWYISLCLDSKRITRSLKTSNKCLATKRKELISNEILNEQLGLKKKKNNIPFTQLVEIFLASNNHWSRNTRLLYERILKSYISGDALPTNPTSRAIYIRHINCCWNWGFKKGLVTSTNKLAGDIVGEARDRVLNDKERKLLKVGIECPQFNRFVRFAYYTGARSSEIRSLQKEMVKDDYIISRGKTGKRMIKLNNQLSN